MVSKAKNVVADVYNQARKMFSFLEDPRYFPVIAVVLLIYIFFGPALLPFYVIEFLNSGLVRLLMLVIVAVLLTGSPALAGLFLVAFLVTVLAARTTVFDYFEDMNELKEEVKKEATEAAKEEVQKLEDEKKSNEDKPKDDDEENKPEDTTENYMNVPVNYQAGLVAPGKFNYTSNCIDSCSANGLPLAGASADSPCNAVAAFAPELNAQGMNCTMGFGGPVAGANF